MAALAIARRAAVLILATAVRGARAAEAERARLGPSPPA